MLMPPCPFASGPLQRDFRSAARQDSGYFYTKFLGSSLVVDGLAGSRSGGGKSFQRILSDLRTDKGTGRLLNQQWPSGNRAQGNAGPGAATVLAKGKTHAPAHSRARHVSAGGK